MLDKISIELLVEIFNFLSFKEKIKNACISKKFNDIMTNTRWYITKINIKEYRDLRCLNKFKFF